MVPSSGCPGHQLAIRRPVDGLDAFPDPGSTSDEPNLPLPSHGPRFSTLLPEEAPTPRPRNRCCGRAEGSRPGPALSFLLGECGGFLIQPAGPYKAADCGQLRPGHMSLGRGSLGLRHSDVPWCTTGSEKPRKPGGSSGLARAKPMANDPSSGPFNSGRKNGNAPGFRESKL
jgi:hypothetical protein